MNRSTKWKLVAVITLVATTLMIGVLDFGAIGTISGMTLFPAVVFMSVYFVTSFISEVKEIFDEKFEGFND